MHPGLNLIILFIHSFILLLSCDAFLPVRALTVKGAGGKPFPLALAERVIFLGYVWPEFTTGEYMSRVPSIQHDIYANDS